MKMTKAEAEKHVRIVQRRCLGPVTVAAGKTLLKNIRSGIRKAASTFGLDADKPDFAAGLAAVAKATPGDAAGWSEKDIALAQAMLLQIDLTNRLTKALLETEYEKAIRANCGELIEAGREREADALLKGSRAGCGNDFNDVILAAPLDGETRVVTCPKCGIRTTYTPPEIEITDKT